MSKVSNLVNENCSSKQQFVKKESDASTIADFIYQTANLVENITDILNKSCEQDKTCNTARKDSKVCKCIKADDYKNSYEYCKDFLPKACDSLKADKSESDKSEMVDHPSHYQGKKFEVIDIIEDYDLGFNLGNALKYLLRCKKKWNKAEDIKKAIWYLNRELSSCAEA